MFGSSQKSLQEFWEWSEGPPVDPVGPRRGPGVVGRPSEGPGVVGRLSRRFGSCREALPNVRSGWEALSEVWE